MCLRLQQPQEAATEESLAKQLAKVEAAILTLTVDLDIAERTADENLTPSEPAPIATAMHETQKQIQKEQKEIELLKKLQTSAISEAARAEKLAIGGSSSQPAGRLSSLTEQYANAIQKNQTIIAQHEATLVTLAEEMKVVSSNTRRNSRSDASAARDLTRKIL